MMLSGRAPLAPILIPTMRNDTHSRTPKVGRTQRRMVARLFVYLALLSGMLNLLLPRWFMRLYNRFSLYDTKWPCCCPHSWAIWTQTLYQR